MQSLQPVAAADVAHLVAVVTLMVLMQPVEVLQPVALYSG